MLRVGAGAPQLLVVLPSVEGGRVAAQALQLGFVLGAARKLLRHKILC